MYREILSFDWSLVELHEFSLVEINLVTAQLQSRCLFFVPRHQTIPGFAMMNILKSSFKQMIAKDILKLIFHLCIYTAVPFEGHQEGGW